MKFENNISVNNEDVHFNPPNLWGWRKLWHLKTHLMAVLIFNVLGTWRQYKLMTYSRDCQAFKKIYGAVYKIIVTFVGIDQIK